MVGLRRARRCGWRRSRVDELLPERVDTQIHAFQRMRPQEDQVPRLAEHDLVKRLDAGHADPYSSSPAGKHCTIGLAKVPHLDPLDFERFEGSGGGTTTL